MGRLALFRNKNDFYRRKEKNSTVNEVDFPNIFSWNSKKKRNVCTCINIVYIDISRICTYIIVSCSWEGYISDFLLSVILILLSAPTISFNESRNLLIILAYFIFLILCTFLIHPLMLYKLIQTFLFSRFFHAQYVLFHSLYSVACLKKTTQGRGWWKMWSFNTGGLLMKVQIT